jgi:hypothetical protein
MVCPSATSAESNTPNAINPTRFLPIISFSHLIGCEHFSSSFSSMRRR